MLGAIQHQPNARRKSFDGRIESGAGLKGPIGTWFRSSLFYNFKSILTWETKDAYFYKMSYVKSNKCHSNHFYWQIVWSAILFSFKLISTIYFWFPKNDKWLDKRQKIQKNDYVFCTILVPNLSENHFVLEFSARKER